MVTLYELSYEHVHENGKKKNMVLYFTRDYFYIYYFYNIYIFIVERYDHFCLNLSKIKIKTFRKSAIILYSFMRNNTSNISRLYNAFTKQ